MDIIYIIVYVDDILIIGGELRVISQLIRTLTIEFVLKDLDKIDYF